MRAARARTRGAQSETALAREVTRDTRAAEAAAATGARTVRRRVKEAAATVAAEAQDVVDTVYAMLHTDSPAA